MLCSRCRRNRSPPRLAGPFMAVFITSTVTARCWKEHTCIACGCEYRYLFERTARATGGPGTSPGTDATYKAMKALYKGVKECPCPTCGTVQPDMVAKGKVTWHLAFTAITGVILALVVLAALDGALPLDGAGQVAAAVVGFGLLGHLIVA